jgi:tetratricopeptide (TPR) repeat protein
MKIATGAAQEKDFKKITVIMATQPFDAQSILGMGNLADIAIASKDPKNKRLVIEFLISLNRTSKNAYVYQFKKVYTYTLARLYLAEQNYEEALNYFSQAIDIHNDMDAGMNMVAIMANAGRPVEASIMLQKLEVVYKRPNVFLQQSRESYDKEIVRIKKILKQDLEAIGISELIIKQPSQEK